MVLVTSPRGALALVGTHLHPTWKRDIRWTRKHLRAHLTLEF